MDFLKWFRKPRVKPLPPPPEPLKVTHAVCSVCKKTVEAFNTYSDGRVKCLPCAIRGK